MGLLTPGYRVIGICFGDGVTPFYARSNGKPLSNASMEQEHKR